MITDNDVEELVAATHKLVTVCKLAAENLSDEFDNLVTPSAEQVREILQRFDPPSQWAGELLDEDIEETAMERRDSETQKMEMIGVELRHKPTGIGRQCTSKITKEQNRDVARRSLEVAVRARWERMQQR